MKYGMRTPSIKRSVKARTTGRAKRAVKSSVNPLYGKKGMGYINDPKKAVYNKVYNKTTFGIRDAAKSGTNSGTSDTSPKTAKSANISILIFLVIMVFAGLAGSPALSILSAIVALILYINKRKKDTK